MHPTYLTALDSETEIHIKLLLQSMGYVVATRVLGYPILA
jgi:hypothetical protein